MSTELACREATGPSETYEMVYGITDLSTHYLVFVNTTAPLVFHVTRSFSGK